jgi:hypothetical protein
LQAIVAICKFWSQFVSSDGNLQVLIAICKFWSQFASSDRSFVKSDRGLQFIPSNESQLPEEKIAFFVNQIGTVFSIILLIWKFHSRDFFETPRSQTFYCKKLFVVKKKEKPFFCCCCWKRIKMSGKGDQIRLAEKMS